MKSLQDYTTVIRPDNNGTYVAYIPAISGCHAWVEARKPNISHNYNCQNQDIEDLRIYRI